MSEGSSALPASLNRSRSRWFRSISVPLLLGLLCLLVYNANLRQIGSGDTIPARYQPLGLWHFGTLTLDPIARWVARGHVSIADWTAAPPADVSVMPPAYWIVRGRDQHLVSFYPVVTPLLVAPLYLPAVAYLNQHGWQQPEVDRVAELMEKLSASLLAALASIVMYLVLRRDAGRWSFILALAFAFGTNTWMISSQALWQHGAGGFLIALALLLAISPGSRAKAVALGAVCVLIAANRPPDALIAGAFAFHALWSRWRTVPWLLAGAALLLVPLLLYNLGVAGSIAGGYGKVTIQGAGGIAALSLFQNSVWAGIAGLLVSPTRGLLIFSPFLILVPLGLIGRLRNAGTRSLAIPLAVAVIAQVSLYALTDWRGGTSWGPRYLTDILPVLVWLLAPAALILPAIGRAFLAVAIAASVVIQGIGAFWYTGASEGIIFGGDPASMRAAWDIKNAPFLVELRHPPARGELQCSTATALERIAGKPPDPGGPTLLAPGSLIEGWALACGRTPADLFLLINGVIIGSTQHFIARPDVDQAMGTKSPSGWTVAADLRGVSPGEHVLQIALRLEPVPTSQPRIVHEQRVLVSAPAPSSAQSPVPSASLPEMADRAASALRDTQGEAGYWLTSHTIAAQFENPILEMNTFLTAMMIDFLSPIAREHGLDDSVERARRHLAAQIESNGLVRYHGLPDAPTINKLGYVITPDSDDTALAWRIANPGAADPRRGPMLKKLAAYRDTRGLYRTWLAPQEEYQSINPGRDPNPADATIQMNVYLMLREFDPPAANELCAALQRLINEDDLWVYYAKAPLLPYLRSAELPQRDCAIPILENRLASSVAGQEVWIETARRLVGTMAASPSPSDKEAIFALLAKIGRDDFAELRRTPPLLYHNDLTASVSRYYWSSDFGYALWLRLYQVARGEATSPAVTAP